MRREISCLPRQWLQALVLVHDGVIALKFKTETIGRMGVATQKAPGFEVCLLTVIDSIASFAPSLHSFPQGRIVQRDGTDRPVSGSTKRKLSGLLKYVWQT